MVVWLYPTPMRPCLDVATWDASPWCQLLRAYLPPFSLRAMLCLPCLLCHHFYTLAYMFMHESCLLVCHSYFNTMKLWTFNPNLHFSLVETTFCLPSYFVPLFVCLSICLLSRLFVHLACLIPCHLLCLPCLSYLSVYAPFICSLYLFLPLLVS